ncbi:2OG-Fe(II) oxygenase [Sphingomonas bacterium]|uniref:2OG-Fe(II) oxygenase n=1 Tax=Sphingomonas bacterium TaxID=1895847 RepID=UPI002625F077|nr:2OG-Fe(II) oxygenase [Sphingomonas bacterium]MDB5678015.1 redoxin protein [Sphingomonas bacterium]
MSDVRFVPGEPAPWFHAKALDGNPRFAFHTVAGRPVMMLFHASGAHPAGAAALATVAAHRDLFDDVQASLFGVSVDPSDISDRRIAQQLPGIRWFIDDDHAISKAYHATVAKDGKTGYRPHWLVLDRMLRVIGSYPIDNGEAAMAALRDLIASPDEPANAPVLIAPRVFEPVFCRTLIEAYDRDGGQESGFMRDVDGVTVEQFDHDHKRRSDYLVTDPELQRAIHARLKRLLAPAIQRAFQFEVTRVERLLVACYDSEAGGGHFRAHRDNTTNGTAHRRFACTINLNADDYEGGDLCFPEFGPRTYRAPTGGAVIFSCSLLHEARPVTKGKRYAFLPFFYDEAAAQLRERNLSMVAPELQHYRAGAATGD